MNSDMSLEALQRRRDKLHKVAGPIYAEMKNYEVLYKKQAKKWDKIRKAYELVDAQLAELDGRVHKVTQTQKVQPKVEFTLTQIQSIAKKLGVKL